MEEDDSENEHGVSFVSGGMWQENEKGWTFDGDNYFDTSDACRVAKIERNRNSFAATNMVEAMATVGQGKGKAKPKAVRKRSTVKRVAIDRTKLSRKAGGGEKRYNEDSMVSIDKSV